MAGFTGNFPPGKAGVTLPAADYASHFIPAADFDRLDIEVSGAAGATEIYAPHGVSSSGVRLKQIEDTPWTGWYLDASGEYVTAQWHVGPEVDVTSDIGFGLLFTTDQAPDKVASTASGKVTTALSVARFSPTDFTDLSGQTAVSPTNNGTDWGTLTTSGNNNYSGQASPMMQVGWISGYVSGYSASGTNFKNNDVLQIRGTYNSNGGTTGFKILVIGMVVYYKRNRV